MSKLKTVLIGCGAISKKHIDGCLKNVNDIELTAVCDIVKEKARETAELYTNGLVNGKQNGSKNKSENTPEIYTDYKEAIEKEKPDIVAIATSSSLHYDPAVAALESGAHVVLEKPMALSTEEAEEINKTAAEKNRKIAVCYVSRFFPHVQDAHKRLQEGSFGNVLHVSADVYWNRNNEYYTQAPWRGTWEKDGGTLMNQCTHSIDLAAWFLNSPPESVYGVTRRYLRPIEAEDFGTAIIQCENGAVGTVKGTVDVFPKNLYTELHIIGEKGTVVFEGTHMEKVRTWLFEGEEWYEPSEDNRLTGHAAVYADLIEALRSDREPFINGEEGKKSLDIVLGIYKSMKEKAIVDFPIDFSLQKMRGVI